MEDYKDQIKERVTKQKVDAFDKAVHAEANLKALENFIGFLKESWQVKNLFGDSNPWCINIDEGRYSNPGITFHVDNNAGCFEFNAETRMAMIELILSKIHSLFRYSEYVDGFGGWELISKDTYSLRYRYTVSYEDRDFDIDIYSYGANESCERKTRKVWKEVYEDYLDCGMERDDDPAPFIGANGTPIMTENEDDD